MTSLLVRALSGEAVERVPIWLMRQAGRHLPGYRRIRESHDLLDIVRSPDLAVEATREPVERYGMDAAIVFSDLTVPFFGLGVRFSVEPSIGPVVERPVRTKEDVEALHRIEAARYAPFVGTTIQKFREQRPDTPILGFAGAPFTLGSYLIEGRPSRDLLETKRMLRTDPSAFALLQRELAEAALDLLSFQVRAGAHAVQVFDTWAGMLSRQEFDRAVLPHLRNLFEGLNQLGVPTVYFSTGASHLLPCIRELRSSAVGVDWRLPLSAVRRELGDGIALHGNLDPSVLLARPEEVLRGAREVLDEIPGGRGHVFNLGHGVLPQTPPENVEALVRFVRRYSEERRGSTDPEAVPTSPHVPT